MVQKLILPGLLLIAGCQATGGTFCDLARPIRLSPEQISKLSDAQVAEFLGQNARGEKFCGWRK